jgi:hypothetical protein
MVSRKVLRLTGKNTCQTGIHLPIQMAALTLANSHKKSTSPIRELEVQDENIARFMFLYVA